MGSSAKKEFTITPVPGQPTLYEIKYSCGGEVPKMLGGKWTSHTDAMKRINHYLSAVKRKPSKKSLEAAGE